MDKFTVSPSPHVHSGHTVEKLMYGVVMALVPAFLVSIFMYGIGAIIITAISVGFCLLFEYLIQKFLLKSEVRIKDGSALVTGILLAFNLPSDLPWWIIMIGAIAAIGVGKMTFGGLGNNPFNPALVGRVFLLISFPVQMTSYPIPQGLSTAYMSHAQGFTGPTPLAIMKESLKQGLPVAEIMHKLPSYTDMFLGKLGGSMGEIAGAALIIGLIFMLIRKIITWHIPVSIIGTVFIFTGILWIFSLEGHQILMEKFGLNSPFIHYMDKNLQHKVPFHMADPVFHLVTGGLLLGAIFMATDYVTSPMTHKGMLIFGVGIGVITVIIRVFGAYPEGVSFAILIMNAFVPLINRYVKPKRFGKEVYNG